MQRRHLMILALIALNGCMMAPISSDPVDLKILPNAEGFVKNLRDRRDARQQFRAGLRGGVFGGAVASARRERVLATPRKRSEAYASTAGT